MSNGAWVCFDCRLHVRRQTQYRGHVACPECTAPCTAIGSKLRVPPKTAMRAWRALAERMHAERADATFAAARSQLRTRHSLEQEIRRLDALPANPGRERAIRALRRQLAARS